MPPNPEATRRQLIDAAEVLFAERGLEAVSLREITTAASVRNSTALQYHFGDRDGLVRAVLAKHHGDVEVRRHALLDAWEVDPANGAGAGDVRDLVAAYVRPAAAELANPDGGRAWLRIMAQLLNRPDVDRIEMTSPNPRDSTNRWRSLVAPFLPEVAVTRLHRRFAAIRLTHVELARRAEMRPRRDDRLFTSHLVDLATAVLTAPLSEETAALLAATTKERSR